MNLNQDTTKGIESMRAGILEELHKQGYLLMEDLERNVAYHIIGGMGKLFDQATGKAHYVEYQEGFDDFRYSKSLNEIGPHTEYPYLNIPPKYQVLYCVKPSDCDGGYTYTCDTKGLMEIFNKEELDILTSLKIDFNANKDLKNLETQINSFPIVSKGQDRPYIFRFSHNLLYYGDVNANIHAKKKGRYLAEIEHPYFIEIVQKILDYFNTNKQVWKIPKNGLLIWNNHHVVHWRSSYSDTSRKLIRYLIK